MIIVITVPSHLRVSPH